MVPENQIYCVFLKYIGTLNESVFSDNDTYLCNNKALFKGVSPVRAVWFISMLYSIRHTNNSSNSSALSIHSTAICNALAPVILLLALTFAPAT